MTAALVGLLRSLFAGSVPNYVALVGWARYYNSSEHSPTVRGILQSWGQLQGRLVV